MEQSEFQSLLKVKKTIRSDIKFVEDKNNPSSLIFEDVIVENDLGWEVYLNGTFKPELNTVVFNFVIQNIGPVCRVCVRGSIHKDAGRTHKHEYQSILDSRRNLRSAHSRKDLDQLRAREVFNILCEQANIELVGNFIDPEAE
ncbi:hypothetical protein [Peredibacter starrii]|uniref:Uncharacterized protein n=1 Tax=Peredibacter starrii TaxID=28202 RepID=A0AAX4HTE8_9BACT|nr:hypothetical protein [Peredibacter starrii]WPU66271.1 hypothetical protein SOO65_05880 [Peredibacter starrii]